MRDRRRMLVRLFVRGRLIELFSIHGRPPFVSPRMSLFESMFLAFLAGAFKGDVLVFCMSDLRLLATYDVALGCVVGVVFKLQVKQVPEVVCLH